MSVERVIIVTAEEFLRKTVGQFLRRLRIDCAEAGTLQDAHDYLGKGNFDLMLLDETLPDGAGLDFLQELSLRPSKPLVVLMSGSVESALAGMKEGAYDHLLKPFSNEQIQLLVKKAEQFAQVVNVNQFLTQGNGEEAENEMLGQCAAADQLRKLIRRVAVTNATVLIQGENGTGKELVARALHRLSPRKDGPFIKLNCASLPESLVESELFGHEKGSFTGATNKREGRFELAHNGTIFLDEISEMPLSLQAKLLRVLQEREFERVGGNRTVKVDVRVIAATNRKLEECVEKNQFRQDLYFRLNVVPILVPPLRDRVEDIPLLAEAFTQRFIRKHGVTVQGLSAGSNASLRAHRWPGNIRELQNVIERAVILCGDEGLIEPSLLGIPTSTATSAQPMPNAVVPNAVVPNAVVPNAVASAVVPSAVAAVPYTNGAPATLAQIEKGHILSVLRQNEFNRTQTAKALDINIRTLRNKLNEYQAQGEEIGRD